MYDQILQLVKQHLENDPQVASTIPEQQKEAVHNEVAQHVTEGIKNQVITQGGIGGLLSKLENAAASGGPVTSAIEGGLVNSLASKFGLPPMVTGAIAGALPGILQKLAQKATNPNDTSLTPDNISKSVSDKLGGFFK